VKRNRRRPKVKVTGGGWGVVGHAGARLLADLADGLGLTDAMSAAMAPTKQRNRGHDRGEVLVDLAVMVADGGEAISDLAVLRDQLSLFGEVASNATAWRALEAVDDAALERLKAARAKARAAAWEAGADPGYYVVDIDATLIGSHSDKERAAPTYKHGYGFHPLLAFLDATGEALAGLLRPGNAGSGTGADHIAVLDDALGQLPVDPQEVEVIARTDTAGCSHEFLDGCRERGVRFVTGHQLSDHIAELLAGLPARRWLPALTADGTDERKHAQVAEVTALVGLSGWPPGTRMIARREEPHPGAQLTFTDVDGHRYQVFVTDLPDRDVAYLEALYRGRGRAERRICDAKDTGLANLPSWSFDINHAWLHVALTACDLLAWSRLLTLDGALATAEPKRLRYCLLHVPAVVVHRSRQRVVRIAEGWPWAATLIGAFERLEGLHLRT